jgi:cellulose biosynthesis protein BcsQ
VLVCCWSSKGGSGTTVVATALAVLLAKQSLAGTLLVDLAGDVPAVLGLSDDDGRPGVTEWLEGGDLVPADGLARVELQVSSRLAVLPRGCGHLEKSRAPTLSSLLAHDPRAVVVDGGSIDSAVDDGAPAALVAALAAEADHSLLVVRPCFLALRRAVRAPLRPTGVVLVEEAGRALVSADVEDALSVPVQAVVSVTAQVARAVDAGLLASRLPRTLERELRHVA